MTTDQEQWDQMRAQFNTAPTVTPGSATFADAPAGRDVATQPVPQASSPGFLSKAADAFRSVVPQGVRDVVGGAARFATSGKRAIDTLGNVVAPGSNLGTRASDELEKVPYAGHLLSTAFDIGLAPSTLLTAGFGGEISAGLRGLGAAGKIGAALLSPISDSSNVGVRLLSEIVAGTGGSLTAEEAAKHNLPAPLVFGAGVLGGGAALALQGAVRGALTPRGAPKALAEAWGLDLGNREFLNAPMPLDRIKDQIQAPGNAIEASRAGRAINSMVNPSKNLDGELGKLHLASQNQRAYGNQQAEVGVSAALDTFNKGTGNAVGPEGQLFKLDDKGNITNLLAAPADKPTQILDVFSDPKAPETYHFTPEQTEYYDAFHKLTAEVNDLAVQHGVNLPKTKLEDTLYVMRVAQGTADVDFKRLNNPSLSRLYETAQEGVAAGVRYENDPRSIALLQAQRMYSEIADKQFNDAVQSLVVKPKAVLGQVYPDVVAAKAKAAVDLRDALKAGRAERDLVMNSAEQGTRDALTTERELARKNTVLARLEEGTRLNAKQRVKRGYAGPAPSFVRRLDDLRADIRHLTEGLDTQRAAAADVPAIRQRNGPPLSFQAQERAGIAKDAYKSAKADYANKLKQINSSEALPEYVFGNNQSTTHIRVGKWKGSFLPETADYLKLAEDVNTMTGRPQPVKLNPLAKGMEEFGNVMRFTSAGADLGMPFIQGVPLFGQNPLLWAKMAYAHYRTALDPSFAGRYLRDNLSDVQEMTALGIPLGDVESFLATKGGTIKKVTGYIDKTSTGRTVMNQTLKRLEGAYNVGTTAARVELYKNLKPVWDGTPEEMATYVRDMTGALSSASLGVSRTQRAMESTWLGFSPRLMRSTIALIGHAADPTSAVGRQAAKSLLGLASFAAVSAVTTNIGLGLARGDSAEKIQQSIKDTLDPTAGRKFLSVAIGGQYVGVGGQVRAITQFVAKALTNPAGFMTADAQENPLINFYMGRGAVGVNVASSLVEGASGGKINAVPFENIDNIPSAFAHLGKATLPFAIQAQMDAHDVSSIDRGVLAVTSIAGLNTTPKSPSQRIDEIAQNQYGKPYGELTGVEQQEMEKTRPDLFTLKEQAKEQYGSKDERDKLMQIHAVDSTRMQQERSLVDAYTRGQVSSQQFRDEMKAVQRDASVKKRTLYGDQEFVGVPDSNKEALTKWYNTFDASKINGTEIVDWDRQAQLENDLMKTLTPEQKNFIDQRRKTQHAPEAQPFYDNEQTISDSGYYDANDKAFAKIKAAAPAGIENYSDLALAIDKAKREGERSSALALQRLKNRADRSVDTLHTQMRRADPALDSALVVNGRVSKLLPGHHLVTTNKPQA